jgi:hypothetical protein
MKLDAIDARAAHVNAYLDGVFMPFVVFADTEAGVIRALQHNDAGQVVLAAHGPITEEHTGTVTLELREGAPPAIQEWFANMK